MTMQKTKSIPAGMHPLSPHLVCTGAAEALEFYKEAFDAVEMVRLLGKDGKLMRDTGGRLLLGKVDH